VNERDDPDPRGARWHRVVEATLTAEGRRPSLARPRAQPATTDALRAETARLWAALRRTERRRRRAWERLWERLSRERTPPHGPELRDECRTQFARRLARQACRQVERHDHSIRVYLLRGGAAPYVRGEGHYWTSVRTGEIVHDGHRYWRGGGWPEYHPSTRRLLVGEDWLLARLVAAIDAGEDRRRRRPRRPRGATTPATGPSQP
jgi:hypothetical protein